MNKKRILLAQSDQAARDRIKDLLPQAACEVLEANNGAEAFALSRIHPLDLIILDSDLAFIPGHEVAELVRRQRPHQPLLMLSATPKNFSADIPVDVVLHKACHQKRLAQEIHALLNPEPQTRAAASWELESPSAMNAPISA